MLFVLCYAPIHLSYYPFYFSFIVLCVLLTVFVFCDLNYFSLRILLFVPFVQKCRDHCQRVETQLQYMNIISYRTVTHARKGDVWDHNFLCLIHYHYIAYTPPIPTSSSSTPTNQTHCPTSTLESREGMQNKLGSGMWRLREATSRSGS